MVLAFLIVSLVLFIMAALSVPSGNFALGWAGAAFFVAAQLVGRF